MATYSTSPRLIKAYRHCRGYYCGFGPVNTPPKRLRVTGFIYAKRKPKFAKFYVMLQVANRRKPTKSRFRRNNP